MIKKLITFIFYLYFLTCGDESITGGDDGGGPSVDCMGDPRPSDCPINETVDGVPGCAYIEDYCTGGICVGGTSTYSEEIAYCDCNGDWFPEDNDCTDMSTTGCGQEDGCGVCYGGTSAIQEYTNCDCNGDLVPEDCGSSPPNTFGCAINDICGCVGGNTGTSENYCAETACPDNFSLSPQSTLTEFICVPDNFFYYVSTMQAGYIIDSINSNSIILETSNCEDCDWVGAFNGDVCVGATEWNTENCLNGICSINVMGAAGESTSEYMLPGEIPTFKVYDVSENVYYDAISSQDYPWYPGQVYPGGQGPDIILTLVIP